MFRLAHISDVHLGPMPKVAWHRLLSKRITGYINWQRNRAKDFSPTVLNNLVAHLLTSDPDHLVITGDLVNLALPEEIERAARWLKSQGAGEDISIVCGNHDAYVNNALEQAIIAWQDYLVGDDRHAVVNNSAFPILRRRGPCSIILTNSAVPTKPFDATGRFDQQQAERLEKMLMQEKQNCRVVLIHHPPFANATVPSKRLIGDDLFRDVILKCGAELVLHGHTHLDTLNWIDGPDKPTPVVCVPAGGQSVGGKKPAAHYNIFDIEQNRDGWSLTQNKIGYKQHQSGISLLEKVPLVPHST